MTPRTADALALSLAEALIVEVANRAAERKDGALINRLNRALVQLEASCYLIPKTSVDASVCSVASYLGDLLSARIQSVVRHGGLRRGEVDLDRFQVNMLERLNDPKNVAKGDYREISYIDLKKGMDEEKGELVAELWLASNGENNSAALIREAADRAVVAMFCAVKAESCC